MDAEEIIAALPKLTHAERRALARRIFELASETRSSHEHSMDTFDTAQELLQSGETGLFVHTDGLHFTHEVDGSGTTGNWVINPTRHIDRVVIVRWERRGGQRFTELFTARPDKFVRLENGRYEIKLIGVRLAGSTDRSWMEFAGTGRNPVKYVFRPTTGQIPA